MYFLLTGCERKQHTNTPSASTDSIEAPVPLRNKRVNATLTGNIRFEEWDPFILQYYLDGFGESISTKRATNDFGFFSVSSDQMPEDATILNYSISGIPLSAPVLMQQGRTHFIKRIIFQRYKVWNISTSGHSFNDPSQPDFAIQYDAGSWLKNQSSSDARFNINTFVVGNKAAELEKFQPGDLRGINKDGKMVVLSPYLLAGFFPQEEPDGRYQIAPGKMVGVKVTIPNDAQRIAPDEATVWVYDIKEALWKEGGKVKRTGNQYLYNASVSGFFCIAEQSPAVFVHLKLVDKKENPLPFRQVVIMIQSQDASRAWPLNIYTNNTGELSAYLPYNTMWSMVLKDECNSIYTSRTMQPVTQNTWKVLEIEASSTNQSRVEGKAFSCEMTPMEKGAIIIKTNTLEYSYPIKNGKYSFDLPMCGNRSDSYQFKIYDSLSQQITAYKTFNPYKGTTTTMPDVEVCAWLTKYTKGELIVNVDGKTYTLTDKTDSLAILFMIDPYLGRRITGVTVLHTDIFVTYPGETTGTFKIYTCGFKIPSSQSYLATWGIYGPGTITVDELDMKRGIMRGNFTSTVNRNPRTDNLYDTTTLSGTFNLHL
ncbi:MAG: hypothetical protein J7623_16715 [Chitinophaga sp.]|nr:hypothetical protein [Chitinophaga sp.]